MNRRALAVFLSLVTTSAWAADRELTLRVGEKRSFNLPGVAQIAVDDATVIEGTAKDDHLDVEAHHAGSARILVLLKNDQWVTFHVKVGAGDVPEGPVLEALPNEGEPLMLRIGERRAFETPGIARLPLNPGGPYDVKVTGKQVELRGLVAGRAMFELWLQGGKHLSIPVVVEGVAGATQVAAPVRRSDFLNGEAVQVPVNGEQLVKVLDVESVSVEDDDVAEVRIVADGRFVVRGLADGETHVLVRRAGRVYSYPVNVTSGGD